MSRRKMPSFEDLSAAIAAIHDAGAEHALWPATLQRIGGLFDAPGATVWMQDSAGGFRDVNTNELNLAMVQDYSNYYGRLDKLRFAMLDTDPGTVLTNAMVLPRPEFIRTEFYADFARRHDAHDGMEAYALAGPGYSGHVGVARSSRVGAFGEDDVRLLGLLLPHLRRAMRTQLCLASLGVERDCAFEALDRLSYGVLVADTQARVTYANSAAEATLRTGDGLGLEPGTRRLCTAAPGRTAALRCLIDRAARGSNGALQLERPATASPLLVCAAPLRVDAAWNMTPRPAALLFLGTPGDKVAPSPALLRALYELTPAEAAVTVRIGQGQGVKDAAVALDVAPSTLRWHLQRVFEKTGTARQAELARLVERLGTVAGDARDRRDPNSGPLG